MSDGVTGEKPLKPYQQLGPDVTIENLDLDSDKHSDMLLRDAGKAMTPAGKEYMGSVAIHWYKTAVNALTVNYELDIKQQDCTGDMNPNVRNTGLSAFFQTMARKYMGLKMNSTDSKDKRNI